MRDRLIAYVDLLFAGNPEAADVKQEILQNTLDRYDDLLAEGRSPEAAYSLAISGIGDLSEVLGRKESGTAFTETAVPGENQEEQKKRKLLRSIAVGLYIGCPIPMLFFLNKIGVSLLLTMVAIATVMMIFAGKDRKEDGKSDPYPKPQMTPGQELRKSIHAAVSTVGLCAYFILSFLTGAWHLTWLIFPIAAAVNGLVTAIMDLKEAK